MKRILMVYGTRPEALKLWPILCLARAEYAEDFEFRAWFTNQSEGHFVPDIVPDWSAYRSCGTALAPSFGKIMSDMEWFFNNRNGWDAVMVQGDTFSTLAGAQTAYFRGIPVIHVEAGLRTYRRNPWPEEMIRTQVDGMSKYQFCPTSQSQDNICEDEDAYRRGSWMDAKYCRVTGNTIIDRIEMEPDTWDLQPMEPVILCTLHRRESWDRFGAMMGQLSRVIEAMPEHQFVFLAHPNGKFAPSGQARIRVKPAQDYRSMLALLRRSAAVITDSGGLIEEAAYFKKPCFILRDETERQESIDAGLARIVGRNGGITEIPQLMANLGDWFNPEALCPYGDGQASRRILDFLKDDQNWE